MATYDEKLGMKLRDFDQKIIEVAFWKFGPIRGFVYPCIPF